MQHAGLVPVKLEVVAADGFVRVFNNSGMEIHRSGEVVVESGKQAPLPSVTYILPEKWMIRSL